MKTTQHHVSGLKALSAAWLAIATSLSGYAPTVAAHSDGAIWGIGGLLAGAMFSRAHYEEKENKQTQYTAPPAAAAMTPEQKIQQLNTLAAGGYITPEQYKTEKQAILNSIVE